MQRAKGVKKLYNELTADEDFDRNFFFMIFKGIFNLNFDMT